MPATAPQFGRAPGAWPLLGHVVALQRRPLALLDSLPAHGDLVEVSLGPRPAYVVCHPGLARQVLTDFRLFDRTGLVYERVRTAMGNGLASAAHTDHRRQRLIMQPAFRHEHLRGYAAVMRQEITATMASWHDGAHVDLVDEMFTLTTTIALRALFSSQLDPARAEHLRRAFDTFLRGIYTRAVLPLAGRLPTPGNRRYHKAVATWRAQVSALVENHRILQRVGLAENRAPFALMLGGPDRRTLFICTAEWRPADGHVANLERLTTGPRTGEILALPVEVPGTGRP